jgi:hypothetical protein
VLGHLQDLLGLAPQQVQVDAMCPESMARALGPSSIATVVIDRWLAPGELSCVACVRPDA